MSVRSARWWRIQREYPVSLDPMVYHGLAHGSMRLMGRGAWGMRLPSLLGFLLLQISLWQYVRRVGGERAGVVAAALPALSAAFYYSAEGRPYGLLLGWYGLAVVCWQAAMRGERRRLALAGLAAAIALAVNTHYFGVLLLLPLLLAEVWRGVRSRRVDWGMLAAGAAGCLGIAGILPFRKVAAEFKTNYYGAGSVGLHGISMAYRSIVVDYTRTPMWVQRVSIAALTLGFAAIAYVVWKRWASEGEEAEWALLLGWVLLPFAGLALAAFVTHSIEVRYLLGAVIGMAGFAALVMAPWLRRQRSFAVVMVFLLVALIAANWVRVKGECERSAAILESLRLSPAALAAFHASDGRLYVQNMGHFEVASEYQPEPEVRRGLTLVYSRANELRWNRHDTMALTAMHLARITGLHVEAYEEVKTHGSEAIFAIDHTGWDWTDRAFAADGAQVSNVGTGAAGQVVAVTFAGRSGRRAGS